MTLFHKTVLDCVLLASVVSRAADPPKSDGDKDEKVARLEHMKQAAKSYEITLTSDETKTLALTEEPVLRFDDQVTGVVDGTVFLWTLNDCPAAMASVWIRKSGHEFHEFQSLATAGLTASSQDQAKWKPEKPGIEWKPAPDAPAPAGTAAGRLNQMRAMSREYTASVSTSEKDKQELRLLPQPVFRYGRTDGEIADGAVFAYCKGTNPEVLLLMEAVKKGDKLEWLSAFVRMTSRGCEVQRDKKVVWSVERIAGGGSSAPTDPYFNVVQRYAGPGADKK